MDFQDLWQRQPRQAVDFFDPSLAKVRIEVLRDWGRTVLILLVAIVAVLSLYWGVLFHVEQNLAVLAVSVVDFDGKVAPYDSVADPIVGPAVTRVIEQIRTAPGAVTLGYQILPASDFGGDPLAVRESVYDFRYWAAVIVNPNATALLLEAVSTGNASYDPTRAVQVIIETARDATTVPEYVVPELQLFINQFSLEFGRLWGQAVMANASLTRENLQKAASAVNPGVMPLLYDLRPFYPFTATPAVSIGLIYLIIMAFFSFGFFLPIHMKFVIPKGHPPLKFWQLIIWRWCSTVAAYFFISLVYSLISLAFQIPFWPAPASHVFSPPPQGATAYGRATFVVYWMVNYVGMTGLGLACENMAMLIGMPWTALWLIFWVISNVSTSFNSVELAPGFYRWGYAWPLHQIVEASRQLLFDLHPRIGLNLGILFTWAALGTALFPLCCYFMGWKEERGQRAAQKATPEFAVRTEGGGERRLPKVAGEMPPVRKTGFLQK